MELSLGAFRDTGGRVPAGPQGKRCQLRQRPRQTSPSAAPRWPPRFEVRSAKTVSAGQDWRRPCALQRGAAAALRRPGPPECTHGCECERDGGLLPQSEEPDGRVHRMHGVHQRLHSNVAVDVDDGRGAGRGGAGRTSATRRGASQKTSAESDGWTGQDRGAGPDSSARRAATVRRPRPARPAQQRARPAKKQRKAGIRRI